MAKKIKVNSKKNQSNFLYVIGAAIVIVLLLAVVIYYSGDNIAGQASYKYTQDASGADKLPVKITFTANEKEAPFEHNGKTYKLFFSGIVDGVITGLGISSEATEPFQCDAVGAPCNLADGTIGKCALVQGSPACIKSDEEPTKECDPAKFGSSGTNPACVSLYPETHKFCSADATCVECKDQSSCKLYYGKSNYACVDHVCVPSQECGSVTDCLNGQNCESGFCTVTYECVYNDDCAEGELCSEQKQCVAAACTADTDCAENQLCNKYQQCVDKCTEYSKQTCVNGNTYDYCSNWDMNGKLYLKFFDCEAGKVCENGKCITPTCNNDGTCDATETTANCPNDCVVAVCGNNVQEGGEDCDGTDLNDETCISLGFFEGTLTCGTDCLFDTTACLEQGTNGLFAPPEDGSWGSWNAEPLPTGFACVQTDDEEFENQYVNNPFVKGTLLYTTAQGNLGPASDWANGNQLAERYCNSNGEYMSRYYNCPSGTYDTNVDACYCTEDAQCGAGWVCDNINDYNPVTPLAEGICIQST